MLVSSGGGDPCLDVTTGNQYSGMETFLHLTHSGVGYHTTEIGIETFMCEIQAWQRVTLV